MAQFCSLPNEILRQISVQVMPEDLENFAATSKHIRSVSGPALEYHRRLIQKYTVLSGRSAPETVEPLLKKVLANPRVGHYVKKIELCEVFDDDSEDQGYIERERDIGDWSVMRMDGNACEEQSLDLIHAAVNKSKLLDPNHLFQIHRDIDDGNKEVLVAILMPLLPNLTVLSIEDPEHAYQIHSMMRRSKGLGVFSKLEHVHLNLESGAERLELADLEMFMPLPSLRRLSGTDIHQTEWTTGLLKQPKISNITVLELYKSRIDPRILVYFLAQFLHLQSFVYTSSNVVDVSSSYDPFIIRGALEARVSTTLRNLTILMDLGAHRPRKFMGPLCGFKVLQRVHSDWRCLVPDLEADGDEKEILSLVLPVSLKVLHVVDDDQLPRNNYRSLIYQALQAKTCQDSPLPLLEDLIFTMTRRKTIAAGRSLRDGADQALQQGCDVWGLSLMFKYEEPHFEL